MQARKSHADANTDTNVIRTKNIMSPSPFAGGHNEYVRQQTVKKSAIKSPLPFCSKLFHRELGPFEIDL